MPRRARSSAGAAGESTGSKPGSLSSTLFSPMSGGSSSGPVGPEEAQRLIAMIEKDLALEAEAGRYFSALLRSKLTWFLVAAYAVGPWTAEQLRARSENYVAVERYAANHFWQDMAWRVRGAASMALDRALVPLDERPGDLVLEDFARMRAEEARRERKVDGLLREPTGDEIVPEKWTLRVLRWLRMHVRDTVGYFVPDHMSHQEAVDVYAAAVGFARRHRSERSGSPYGRAPRALPPVPGVAERAVLQLAARVEPY